MRTTTRVPGDQVIAFLASQGAVKTDNSKRFPGEGRRPVSDYVDLIESGQWWESERPICLDARSGMVWQGTDRCVALAAVDWSRVAHIPMFTVEVQTRG